MLQYFDPATNVQCYYLQLYTCTGLDIKDCPGQVDLVVRQPIFRVKLPNRQVIFFLSNCKSVSFSLYPPFSLSLVLMQQTAFVFSLVNIDD